MYVATMCKCVVHAISSVMFARKLTETEFHSLNVAISVRFKTDFQRQDVTLDSGRSRLGPFTNHSFELVLHVTRDKAFLADM